MLKRFSRWFKSLFISSKPTPPPTPTQPELPIPVEEENPSFIKRLKTNALGIIVITEFEGFYAEPYLCPAGVPTIGYGTIRYPEGTKVSLSDPPCTRDQAREWFKYEVSKDEDRVNDFLQKHGIVLNINQFSALMSFVYNLGAGTVTSSRYSINRALVSGDIDSIPDLMLKYNKARNRWGVLRPLKGLTRRRMAEAKLWRKEVKSEKVDVEID